MASTPNTAATLLARLRTIHELTNTETQIAQARTDAVRRELTENADNARARAAAIEAAIRDLGGLPDVVGPLVGRARR